MKMIVQIQSCIEFANGNVRSVEAQNTKAMSQFRQIELAQKRLGEEVQPGPLIRSGSLFHI